LRTRPQRVFTPAREVDGRERGAGARDVDGRERGTGVPRAGAAGALGSAVDSIGSMFGSSGPEVKTKENITYACVTDLQITERPSSPRAMQPGGPKVYQTRLVAGVHQKKLDAQEATPLLQQKLSASVAGNF